MFHVTETMGLQADDVTIIGKHQLRSDRQLLWNTPGERSWLEKLNIPGHGSMMYKVRL